MEYKVEAIPDGYADLGEGPHWDITSQSLYFIDMYGPTVYRYDYKENKTYKAKIENEISSSFIIPIANTTNQFAIGLGRKVGIIEWDGRSSNCEVIAIVFDVENNEKYKDNRFNDAKSDPMGRFFGGTMRSEKIANIYEKRLGNLYRYDQLSKQNQLTHLKDNIGVSNGLAWNVKTKKFYYVDTCDWDIKEYDYDIKTGEIKNQKVLCNFGVNNGAPDGVTIDENGYLYVAMFGSSKICKVNPNNGKIEMEIKLPCEQITSVAFGGPNLDILYVTTASVGGKQLPAGQTFQITELGVKGLSMTKLNITC